MDTERRLRMLEFQTDIDASSSSSISNREEQQQHNMARQILDVAGDLLQTADRELNQLERDDMLGSAVVRGCTELADAVAHLAGQLEEDQTDPERRQLAAACLQDFQSSSFRSNTDSLRLQVEGGGGGSARDYSVAAAAREDATMQDLSESDIAGALGAAAVLLRDVESALRAIEPDEANDLADTAITVAQLFLATLKHLHSQLTPEHLIEGSGGGRSLQESPNITLLPDDDADIAPSAKDATRGGAPASSQKHASAQRMRCLWPPVGPEVTKVLQWSQEELQKQHWLLTAALGITLWPVLTVTAVLGSSAVLADHALQQLYQHFEGTPAIATAEVAAASLYQTSKLALLTAKAVARPTLRVARRQLERHGPGIQEWAAYKIQHPVETVGETVKGVWWCTNQVISAASHQLHEWQQQQQQQDESAVHVDSERHQSVQEMQL